MNELNILEVSTIIAFIGCFVGLAGWLTGRDKRITADAKWRGSVDVKLDMIIEVKSDIAEIKELFRSHSERITLLENKIERLDKCFDEFKRKSL